MNGIRLQLLLLGVLNFPFQCLEIDSAELSFSTNPLLRDHSTSFTGDSLRYFAHSWVDFDEDGDYDLPGYENLGDFFFQALPDEAWALVQGNHGGSWGDYDSDGDLDFYFTGYGNNSASRLLVNEDGSYLDKSEELGVLRLSGRGENVVWGDFDGDLDLDFLATYYNIVFMFDNVDDTDRNFLFRNDSNQGFTEIAKEAGVDNSINLHIPEGAQTVDFNDDGYLDFYVSGRIFLGDGNLGFQSANGIYLQQFYADEGMNFVDFDNDGDFDISLTTVENLILFENQGINRPLIDVSQSKGLGDEVYTIGTCWLDVDNDGDLDFFTEKSGGDQTQSRIYLNHITHFTIGYVFEHSGQASSAVDYNLDGKIDISMGFTILQNETPANNRLAFRLRVLGFNGAYNSHGTKVRFENLNTGNIQLRHVGNPNWLSQDMFDLHLTYNPSEEYQLELEFARAAGAERRTLSFPINEYLAQRPDHPTPLLVVGRDGNITWNE